MPAEESENVTTIFDASQTGPNLLLVLKDGLGSFHQYFFMYEGGEKANTTDNANRTIAFDQPYSDIIDGATISVSMNGSNVELQIVVNGETKVITFGGTGGKASAQFTINIEGETSTLVAR